jgi:DNA-binding helix-hairpin-helix protein with protein kinase domain
MPLKPPFKVRTATGATLELVRELGRGGQGSVYEVADGRHAVKLLHENTPEQGTEWANRLRAISRLPLEGLPVARPIDTLVPPLTGYVMDLLDGMMPLSRLNIVPSGARAVEHYRDTGSLRRRLRLLARTAEVLAALHAGGLVYQDPSPSNIFVSRSADRAEVWLIDTDNLSYAGRSGSIVCTARYRAPELRPGGRRRADSLSDAFAFAVIAFELLTLDHPFIGDALYDGDEEAEAEALTGDYPWVDHADDASNRSSRGIQPRGLVLSPPVGQLFKVAFVDGLRHRDHRPGVAAWADALRAAATSTVVCPGCEMSYCADVSTAWCPWCDEVPSPPALRVEILLALDDDQAPGDDRDALIERGQLVGMDGEELFLTRGGVLGLVADPDRPIFQLRWEESHLKILNHADQAVELVAPDATSAQLLGPGRIASIPAQAGRPMWAIRIARQNRPDRWLRFTIDPGGRR